jgi:preprotein translocase subunit SecB
MITAANVKNAVAVLNDIQSSGMFKIQNISAHGNKHSFNISVSLDCCLLRARFMYRIDA